MSKTFFEFFSPVKILAGFNALENIPFELSLLNVKEPLLITDPGVESAGLLKSVVRVLKDTGIKPPEIFNDVPQDSSMSVVAKGASLYREKGCDGLIALGGGSVIDTAKGINILVSENADDLKKFSGAGVLKKQLKPLMIIPTTAGTGSETTLVAVITDPETGNKVPFVSHFLIPDVAILDPRMTLTLPRQLTAASAMDTLTHAVEAYTGLANNTVSDAHAWSAVQVVSENLFALFEKPDDRQLRLNLSVAATQAGIAFSNSMVGVVHTLGHSVGAVCHVPHGMAMSVLLPHGLEYNLENGGESYANALGKLLLPLAGEDTYLNTAKNERPAAVIKTIRDWKNRLQKISDLPCTLKETGRVQKDDLVPIVQVSLSDASSIYNPVEIDAEDALNILTKAYENC